MKVHYWDIQYDPKNDDIVPKVRLLKKTNKMISEEEEGKWKKLGIFGRDDSPKKRDPFDPNMFK